MASLNLNIPHQLSQGEALARIKQLLSKLQQEQKAVIANVNEQWTGEQGKFSFSTKGFDLAGVITVKEGNINIIALLPFAVALFKGKIKQVIEEKAKQVLAASPSK